MKRDDCKQLVRNIADLIQLGRGFEDIAHSLNEGVILTASKKPWDKNSVKAFYLRHKGKIRRRRSSVIPEPKFTLEPSKKVLRITNLPKKEVLKTSVNQTEVKTEVKEEVKTEPKTFVKSPVVKREEMSRTQLLKHILSIPMPPEETIRLMKNHDFLKPLE